MSLPRALSVQSGLEVLRGDEDISKKTLKEKILYVLGNITVEPILLAYELPSMMVYLTAQNLHLEKACRVNLNFDTEICDAMTNRNSSGYSEIDEIRVQKLVVSMNAWKNALQSFFPVILLMFVGSWSDRRKRRKPCIILPMLGEFLSAIGFIICTYFFYELPMEWNAIMETVSFALTGGWFTMFTGIFSYISSITDEKTRTLRIGVASMADKISATAGTALSGILYKSIGFYGVFSTALALYTIGIIYAAFWVQEVPRDDVLPSKKAFIKDFFDVKHVMDTIKVVFKRGKRNRRKRMSLLMISVFVIVGPLYGTALSLMVFSKILKYDDTILGIISNLSKILASIVYTFAPNSTLFYLGTVIEMLNGTSFIAMRSLISKLVPSDELGKINSFFGVCEAITPLLYGPMYSFVYKSTINWLPGFFFLLGGILTLPSVFIFYWLYLEHKKDVEDENRNVPEETEALHSEPVANSN